MTTNAMRQEERMNENRKFTKLGILQSAIPKWGAGGSPVSRARTPGEEVVGLIPAVATRSQLVGSVLV